MQYLKDEVKNRIMASAVEEFGDKGYQDASMRAIAHKSGITAGNIYRYFINKDALFNAIMEPVSIQMMELVYSDTYFETDSGVKQLYVEAVMGSIMRLCKDHIAELLILIFKSSGSKYEGIKQELSTKIARRLAMEFISERLNLTTESQITETLANAIAAAIIEGVFVILKESHGDMTRVECNIRQLIIFFFGEFQTTQ